MPMTQTSSFISGLSFGREITEPFETNLSTSFTTCSALRRGNKSLHHSHTHRALMQSPTKDPSIVERVVLHKTSIYEAHTILQRKRYEEGEPASRVFINFKMARLTSFNSLTARQRRALLESTWHARISNPRRLHAVLYDDDSELSFGHPLLSP